MTEKKNNKKRAPSQRPKKKSARPPKVQVEISAGGIVYKRVKGQLKIALMLDPFGKWTFAKGHVEPGETIEQAAVRETSEEMMLNNLKLLVPLGTIDFWFREKYRPGNKGKLIHKFVHYYLMEAPVREWGKPLKEEKIRKIAWVSPKETVRRSGYEDVRPVLEKALITLGIRKRIPAAPQGSQHQKQKQDKRRLRAKQKRKPQHVSPKKKEEVVTQKKVEDQPKSNAEKQYRGPKRPRIAPPRPRIRPAKPSSKNE